MYVVLQLMFTVCIPFYCEIINFRGAQFSWIGENEYIRGDVIS